MCYVINVVHHNLQHLRGDLYVPDPSRTPRRGDPHRHLQRKNIQADKLGNETYGKSGDGRFALHALPGFRQNDGNQSARRCARNDFLNLSLKRTRRPVDQICRTSFFISLRALSTPLYGFSGNSLWLRVYLRQLPHRRQRRLPAPCLSPSPQFL